MNNYMDYIKCGEIFISGSLNYKEQYILKCSECREYYSVLEELLNHSIIHYDTGIKEKKDTEIKSIGTDVHTADPLNNYTVNQAINGLSQVLKVETEESELMIDDNDQINLKVIEVCKTDENCGIGNNDWTVCSSDSDVLDDADYEWEPDIDNTNSRARGYTKDENTEDVSLSISKRSIDPRNPILPEMIQNEANVEKPFVCDECGSRLKTRKSLKRHQRIHFRQSDEREHECEYCKRVFQKLSSLKNHLRSHRENCNAGVTDGTESSNDDDDLEELNFEYESQSTPYKFTSKCRRNDKNIADTLEIPEESRDLRNSPAAEISQKEDSEEKQFVCGQCGSRLKTRKSLKRHLRIHLRQPGEKEQTKTKYECEHCKKVFQQSSSLKDHLRIHTGEQPYLCSECGKAFKSLSNMKQHFLRHGSDRPYECPDCPKKFPCLSDLASHKAVHSKTKSHICDVCGAGFVKPYLLKKHKMYHNGEKNHKCDYCDMRFVLADQCRRHMRTHTGEKPYKCKYCVRAFAQSNDLIKHLRGHLGDNVYKCDMCPQGFRLQGDLRAHFNTHKNDDDETMARNLQALKDDELRIQMKFGLVEGSEKY